MTIFRGYQDRQGKSWTPQLNEVLFEFIRQGETVEVAAIDPRTNVEVRMVCPQNYTETTMRWWAWRKLERAVARYLGLPPPPPIGRMDSPLSPEEDSADGPPREPDYTDGIEI